MSEIRLKSIWVKNYRSFGNDTQHFIFPARTYLKPVAIVGYNNAGKSNLLNSILYGLQVKFVSKDSFSKDDFHNRNIENIPQILLEVESSTETKFDGVKLANLSGFHKVIVSTDGDEIIGSRVQSLNSLERIAAYGGGDKDDENWQAFGATRYFNIFYVNFHNIKDEISTKKSSWGNLKSFLAKHIRLLVDKDHLMIDRKDAFKDSLTTATNTVLEGSLLKAFINSIQKNYSKNLRDNNCNIDFSLPEYEDIFLQMMFKIGLNGDRNNMVPIDHFGDGYISMFVMAVIQAIAESNTEDKCLFLFEEPESFLHENHQEYFYRMVLSGLAEKGHQVIYTTHSDRMVDMFDSKGLIRLEIDENNQTVNKYNNTGDFTPTIGDIEDPNLVSYQDYNTFIKTIDPSLSKILFSRKVILVEGPNDVLVYKHAIKEKVKEKIVDREDIVDKEKYAETYLNFHNIAIVPHFGKITAIYLINLCKHIKLDFFAINDWDFDENYIAELNGFEDVDVMKQSQRYIESPNRGMITTNWKLLNAAGIENIHFNVKKLETVIDYDLNDKSSIGIWNAIREIPVPPALFPEKLETFLELHTLIIQPQEAF